MKYENEKDEKDQSKSEFDLFGLGGFFKGLEKLIDMAGKLEQAGTIIHEGEFNSDEIKKNIKGVYGFTIKTAIGNIPKVETFGNIIKTPEGPKVNEEREPIVDIFDESDEVVIIAEMPGVEDSDIIIDIKEDILAISTKNLKKSYRKEILLPLSSDNNSIIRRYTNGILEIKLKK
jgi:HSP20 family protein